jgi:hypothetical protein
VTVRKFAITLCTSLLLLLGLAVPAHAVTVNEKLALLSSWSQPTDASRAAFLNGYGHSGDYAAYHLDWSTDLCSTSPDQPAGFDFRNSCRRHDFGYRNYKAVGQFPANKDRIDSAFYHDMRSVCAGYSGARKTECDGLAWTYYQAVKKFGTLDAVQQSDLDRLERSAA